MISRRRPLCNNVMNRSRLVHVHEDPAWGKASIYEPIDIESVDDVPGIKSHVKLNMGNDETPTTTTSLSTSTSLYSRYSEALHNTSEQDRQDNVDEQSTELIVVDLNSYNRLSLFEACLFSTALEDAITQMRILDESNNFLRVAKVRKDMRHLLALKFNVEEPVVHNPLYGINPYDLNRIEYKINKLEMDRKLINDLFVKLYANLFNSGGFTVLSAFVKDFVEKENQFNQLVEDEANHKILKRALAKQLRQQRNHCKRANYDTGVMIDSLRNTLGDADLEFQITDRYVANWQGARAACHDLIIAQTEARSTDSTEYHRRRADHEQRGHNEVELLTSITINERLQSIEDWMNKYDNDMEEMDLKIQKKRLEYHKILEKRIYLEDKYARHTREIKAWNLFKVERDKANAYRDTMTKSAITVQAWWRGLLVRKGLGPFRPKKKRKGNK